MYSRIKLEGEASVDIALASFKMFQALLKIYLIDCQEQVSDDSSEPERVSWPEQDDEPFSDFTYGYFTKCFPHLCPD